jgi:hypothetical protein
VNSKIEVFLGLLVLLAMSWVGSYFIVKDQLKPYDLKMVQVLQVLKIHQDALINHKDTLDAMIKK